MYQRKFSILAEMVSAIKLVMHNLFYLNNSVEFNLFYNFEENIKVVRESKNIELSFYFRYALSGWKNFFIKVVQGRLSLRFKAINTSQVNFINA